MHTQMHIIFCKVQLYTFIVIDAYGYYLSKHLKLVNVTISLTVDGSQFQTFPSLYEMEASHCGPLVTPALVLWPPSLVAPTLGHTSLCTTLNQYLCNKKINVTGS